MITPDKVKPVLIMGDYFDMAALLNEAYRQGKRIFKTNDKITVVYPPLETPYGWVVLVSPAPVGVVKASRVLGGREKTE